jgi:hypothetical protein
MLLNVVFKLVPSVFTTAMMATEIPAAIRPYSMAVAPRSSFKKRRTRFMNILRFGFVGAHEPAAADIANE